MNIPDNKWFSADKLHFRRTKIVATIGPSSSSPEQLRQLIAAGMNVCRINFSHGDPAKHIKIVRRIRKVADSMQQIVTILGDLCGPKIRVGRFPDGRVTLKDGSKVLITAKNVLGSENLIPSQYGGIVGAVRIGDRVLLDDGNLELRVTRKLSAGAEAVVIHGGVLKDKKGMNLPDTPLKIPALTAKDKKDAIYCIKGGVDYLALSFVKSAGDVLALRRHLKANGSSIPIIAKIEKPEALDRIDEILAVVDGIMIARGDLGVEMPPQKVPLIQRRLIEKANQAYKPVIVATQMLESMIEHARPTRAEVTDVAMACLDDADAVMLSGETAVGKFPVEAVKMMDAVLREAEGYQFFTNGGLFKDRSGFKRDTMLNAIGVATAQMSRDLKVRCISVLTRSGRTARIVSADRPAAPVFGLTENRETARRMGLLWGVYPQLIKGAISHDAFVKKSEIVIKGLKLAKKGDYMILLSGLSDKANEITNSITVHQVG